MHYFNRFQARHFVPVGFSFSYNEKKNYNNDYECFVKIESIFYNTRPAGSNMQEKRGGVYQSGS